MISSNLFKSFISIHAPHEGERPFSPRIMGEVNLFQSTLPTRGSDAFIASCSTERRISIHAPHEGERRSTLVHIPLCNTISIHAPHEGERLPAFINGFRSRAISIHAPHEGERHGRDFRGRYIGNISIHAPHEGERQRKSAFVYSISANLLNIIHCGTVTRAVSRRRIALFRLFSVRRSGVFMYAYASH